MFVESREAFLGIQLGLGLGDHVRGEPRGVPGHGEAVEIIELAVQKQRDQGLVASLHRGRMQR